MGLPSFGTFGGFGGLYFIVLAFVLDLLGETPPECPCGQRRRPRRDRPIADDLASPDLVVKNTEQRLIVPS